MEEKIWFLENIPQSHPVYIYGSGDAGRYIFKQLKLRGYSIAGFIDSFQCGEVFGVAVHTFDTYLSIRTEDDVILVASTFHKEIGQTLRSKGIPRWLNAWPCLWKERFGWGLHLNEVGDWWSDDFEEAFERNSSQKNKGVLQPIDVAERIAQAEHGGKPGFIVNIGCNDGKIYDPCYQIFMKGYGGLCIDGINTDDIFKNLPSNSITKCMGSYITPMNIVPIMRRAHVPQSFDILKIDIDGYDGVILDTILKAGYQPDMVIMEVNADIPPPFKFAVLYHPAYPPSGEFGFYGCSLSYQTELMSRFGYELLQTDFLNFRDAIFVRRALMPLFPPRWFTSERDLFLSTPIQFSHFHAEFGIDVRAWREREDFSLLAVDIWNALVMAAQAKRGYVLPFHFSY